MNRWHSPPAQLYAMVERTPGTVLLECARPNAARPGVQELWTRLFTAPVRILTASEPAEVSALFAEMERAVAAGQFAAGFFSYECGVCFEPKADLRPRPAPGQAGLPLAWFGVYEHCHRFDHRTGAFVDGDPPGLDRFPADGGSEDSAAEARLEATFSLAESEYGERIAAIQEWIRSGDIYQLNFTAPLVIHASGSAAALYARLRRRQPVEFGAFLHCQAGRHILSFSPELFFRIEDEGGRRRITTRPMKGTAPRGRTTLEDRAQAEWLANDPKNRSENVMIVDLLRNDLGRLCRFGSVEVESIFAIERYPTLWQMTSTVRGELRPEIGFQQIFRALFPCGSITGAPKVRAMQLVAQLEGESRGVYTGAIGYFSRERTAFNVAIRTLELEASQAERGVQLGRMGVGSGIVADSDAAEEFRECLLKAEFLGAAGHAIPREFSLLESLLWRDGYPLLELHLDRLEDSAAYFDFACDRAQVKAALLAYAAQFSGPQSRKIRLLLSSQGSAQIESEILPRTARGAHANPVRVCIARQRTDPRDPMLFHKTTHRPLYAAAFQAAAQAGFDEVLFLNQRGELTEGAISNVFIEKDGQWFTPPVECGLLAGVFRRHLLETRRKTRMKTWMEPQPEIAERILSADDLRRADAVYLANAVRGLRRAAIDWKIFLP